VDYARKAVAKGVAGGDYLDMLAWAYFQSGNTREAVNTEEKALRSTEDAQSQETIKRHLAKFTAAERLAH
jgi:hypothetical protein